MGRIRGDQLEPTPSNRDPSLPTTAALPLGNLPLALPGWSWVHIEWRVLNFNVMGRRHESLVIRGDCCLVLPVRLSTGQPIAGGPTPRYNEFDFCSAARM